MNIALIPISKLGELLLEGQPQKQTKLRVVCLLGDSELDDLIDIIRKIVREELRSLKEDK